MGTEPRFDVLVVGAGRVGTVLAEALARAGRSVGLVTRSPSSQARAAQVAPGARPAVIDDPADIVLLCVADDDLADVARRLGQPDLRLVAHTSGRYGTGVLAGVDAPAAAMHPVMTFAGGATDLDRLPGLPYGVTAQGEALERVTALVGDLGGVVEVVADERRPLYHAALSHAANHLVTLIADAADLLRRAGVVDTATVLGPITRAALDNALDRGDRALTGPVVRGDVGTVRAHLAALTDSEAERSYQAMALRTTERAQEAGRLPDASAARLLAVLSAVGTTHARR